MLIVVALIIQATDVIHNVPAGIYGFHAVAMVSLNVRVSVLSSSFLSFNSSKAEKQLYDMIKNIYENTKY